MGKPADKKKKKKGRPSLVDLQKRSLRLQKLHEQKKKQNPNPNPNPSTIPNPYARFPIPSAGRLSSRRNPNPDPKSPSPIEDANDSDSEASMEEDEEDDDLPKERRKEKKLKLVLHLPHPNTNSPDLVSESNGIVSEKRDLDSMEKQTEGKNSAWKATEEGLQGTSDLGPTTPLPDKKLLDFILDRLQKKDIYGVYSEPVDPEELPDYHDIIKHPMDFGTVRKKLSSGTYEDLEQFENDVFLISSNAMRYNAPDTIYFRQARSIHELAKKSFENLRNEGDGGEKEPKMVRRGRPPGSGKNNFKRPVGRPPADRASSEFSSDASLANALNGNLSSSVLRNELLRKGSGQDQQRVAADLSVRPSHYIHSSEAYYGLGSEFKSARNEDLSGSTWKGLSNYGKKPPAMEESRRNTSKQCQSSFSMHECSVLEALDGDRKVLLPVGFHPDHAYARSLAYFAAQFGPIGWNIAAKRIEKVLPVGVKFGRGWVGEINASLSKPSSHSSSRPSNILPPPGGNLQHPEQREEHPLNNSVGQDRHFTNSIPPSSSSLSTVPYQRFHDSSETKGSSPFHPSPTANQPLANGFKVPFIPNLPPHPGTLPGPNAFQGAFGLEAVFAQAHQASTLPSSWSGGGGSGREQPPTILEDQERVSKEETSPTQGTNYVNSLPSSSKGPFPVVKVDSQKPDLALQL